MGNFVFPGFVLFGIVQNLSRNIYFLLAIGDIRCDLKEETFYESVGLL